LQRCVRHRLEHGAGRRRSESDLVLDERQLDRLHRLELDSSSTSTTTSADSSLQTSFNNLVADLGGTGNSTSLSEFLQSFANNLQSTSSLGNLVNAQA